MSEAKNPMRDLTIDKVTLNVGVGASGQQLENAKMLLKRLTNRTPTTTHSRSRNPVFRLKKGEAIGTKVTLRDSDASEFLSRAFDSVGHRLSSRAFDRNGNFSFGIREYIDFPGIKYDPQIGMMGFDVCVTLKRKGGARVARRRRANAKPRKSYRIAKQEAMDYIKNAFNVELV
ncbi:50S ribosomal protein L5 [Candidatus Micrarchaeota archaeon]|nr:MAG: 50S ribosomal protein L5 [Candidatus Micrarchaeota archaeon]